MLPAQLSGPLHEGVVHGQRLEPNVSILLDPVDVLLKLRDDLRVLIRFFVNDTATPEIYTLSLHDALPICPTRESAPVSRPIPTPSSASACTRSRLPRTRPAGSTSRTTAAGANGTGPGGRGPTSECCAATTTAIAGDRSPRGCRPTSASRWSFIRRPPTRSTSCRSSRRRAPARGAHPPSGG